MKLQVQNSVALATFPALNGHHLQYCSKSCEHTWHRTCSRCFCEHLHPACLPFGKGDALCKELHVVVILHEVPLGIDISTLRGFPQAVQGSLRVLLDAMSVEVHEPQGTLGLQVPIAACF